MARSHVPKFGDWEDDNLPYTTYFENARKEKAGMRINPNDPEENPEAFMYMRGGLERKCDCQQPAQFALSVEQSKHNAPNRNSSYDHQKSGRSRRTRSITSESGSEKSHSDHSLLQSNHQRANYGQKKGRLGGSSFSSTVSGQSTKGSGSYQFDGNKQHHKTASVPKFGDWDETDPTSGQGFTAIFNNVKEEKKQAPSSNFPNVPPQPSDYSDCHQSNRPSPSFCSKICCCLFLGGSD